MSSIFQVADPALAAFLSDTRRRRILLAFVGRERSLAEVSTSLAIPLSLLHYHAKRLLALGAVEIVREQARAGRAVRYYRATSDAFFIPTDLMANSVGAVLSRELRAGLDAAAGRSTGMILDLDEAGRPRLRFVGDELAKIPWEVWRLLRLSTRAAEEFATELRALVHRYEERSLESGPTYLFHAGFIRRRGP